MTIKKDNDKVEENRELDEESSAAQDTLKPNSKSAGPDPKSRVEYMKSIIGHMAGLEDHELVKWHNDSIALIGKEARKVGDNEGKNKSSIKGKSSDAVGHEDGNVKKMPMPKISVKEDLESLFNADETLNEEAQERIITIVEAAVSARVMLEMEKLEEQYQTVANEAAAEVVEDLEKQLEQYLEYATEDFMKENEVAITSTLRSELTDEFLTGLRDLFVENFIDIPEEKVDLIEELSNKIEELEADLNKAIEENSDLRELELKVQQEEAFDEIAEGLTVIQREKLEALVEDVEWNGDIDLFIKKVTTIKEHNFPETVSSEDNLDELNEENTDLSGKPENKYTGVDPSVAAYAQAIGRFSRKI